MECTKVKNLLAEYSVGLVEGRQREELEGHLASCPDCTAEYAKLHGVMRLVDDLDAMEPPVGLWNGVYNRITQPEETVSAWQRARAVFRRSTAGWSAGVATAVLAGMMIFSRVHNPAVTPNNGYSGGEYVQGHVIFASQDAFADQAALNTVAALSDREQSEGATL